MSGWSLRLIIALGAHGKRLLLAVVAIGAAPELGAGGENMGLESAAIGKFQQLFAGLGLPAFDVREGHCWYRVCLIRCVGIWRCRYQKRTNTYTNNFAGWQQTTRNNEKRVLIEGLR